MSAPTEEVVILLDDAGRAVGTTAKAAVHHRDTPLHLAFSCYVFDPTGRWLLLTRRALSKPTWPGAWTNTVCGHPAPGEDLARAVRRRAEDELGLRVRDVRLLLPTFRYRAVMPNGTAEHEMCPVFVATTDDEPTPSPQEVEETRWVEWDSLRADVLAGVQEISPWCAEQVSMLPAEPINAPAAPSDLLPPAAREVAGG